MLKQRCRDSVTVEGIDKQHHQPAGRQHFTSRLALTARL
jgi:hypothetical protein